MGAAPFARHRFIEPGGHLGADLEAALADAGADGGAKALGPGTKFRSHGGNRVGGDARHGPTPSGMDGSHSARYRIHQENG